MGGRIKYHDFFSPVTCSGVTQWDGPGGIEAYSYSFTALTQLAGSLDP